MNERMDVEQRLNQLGMKFLERTSGELAALRGLIDRVGKSDAAALEELRQLAHRMHGTGATLGFDAISRYAADIESLCGKPGTHVAQLAEKAAALESEVSSLTHQRGPKAP